MTGASLLDPAACDFVSCADLAAGGYLVAALELAQARGKTIATNELSRRLFGGGAPDGEQGEKK